MHIGVSHFRLVDPFDAFGGEDADGDFLGDDRLALGGAADIKGLLVEVVVAEGVTVDAAVTEEAGGISGVGGVGDDG